MEDTRRASSAIRNAPVRDKEIPSAVIFFRYRFIGCRVTKGNITLGRRRQFRGEIRGDNARRLRKVSARVGFRARNAISRASLSRLPSLGKPSLKFILITGGRRRRNAVVFHVEVHGTRVEGVAGRAISRESCEMTPSPLNADG